LETYLYNNLLFENILNLVLEKNEKTLFTSLQLINLNNRFRIKELTSDIIPEESHLQGILNNYYSKLQKGKLTLNEMKIISLLQTD
jgi:hypothetical protein